MPTCRHSDEWIFLQISSAFVLCWQGPFSLFSSWQKMERHFFTRPCNPMPTRPLMTRVTVWDGALNFLDNMNFGHLHWSKSFWYAWPLLIQDPRPIKSLKGLCLPCLDNKRCFLKADIHILRHLVSPSTISAFLLLPVRLSVRSADVISWKACSKIGDQKNRSCSAYSPSRKPGQRKTILDPSSNWYYWRTGLLSSWRG